MHCVRTRARARAQSRFIEMVLHPHFENLQSLELPTADLEVHTADASDVEQIQSMNRYDPENGIYALGLERFYNCLTTGQTSHWVPPIYIM